jgi:hypothetical protein
MEAIAMPRKFFWRKQINLAMALLPLLCGTATADNVLSPMADVPASYARLSAATAASRCAVEQPLLLPVPTSVEDGLEALYDEKIGRLRLRYRMVFNQLTEGWSWRPLADPEREDYYRYKFLPLGSVSEEKTGYRFEDKIGEPQQMRVQWRYDYFAAFDNPYDFYDRGTEDDAGFAAELPLPKDVADRLVGGDLRMAVVLSLAPDCLSESTTFWKAIYARPVDFTLKKRYLVGRLDEVLFYDAATGQEVARLRRR